MFDARRSLMTALLCLLFPTRASRELEDPPIPGRAAPERNHPLNHLENVVWITQFERERAANLVAFNCWVSLSRFKAPNRKEY